MSITDFYLEKMVQTVKENYVQMLEILHETNLMVKVAVCWVRRKPSHHRSQKFEKF